MKLAFALSLLLNLALIAAAAWLVTERGARTVAEDMGVVEPRRPAFDFYADERFANLSGAPLAVIGDSQVERGPWSEVLDREVAVRGQSGQLTSEVAASAHLVPENAQAVIVWAGSNDVMGEHDPAQIGEDMAVLLDRISTAAPDADLIVLSVPYLKWVDESQVDAANDAIEDTADSAGATFVDVTPALDGLLVHDGVHVTGAGYEAVAEILLSTPSVAGAR